MDIQYYLSRFESALRSVASATTSNVDGAINTFFDLLKAFASAVPSEKLIELAHLEPIDMNARKLKRAKFS